MSNPYAPPGDRPRTPDGDRTDAPPAHEQPPWPPSPARPDAPVVVVEPPDPEAQARGLSRTRLFGVLVLGSVLVATLPLPWQAAALVFAIGGLAVGVWALLGAVRGRTRGLIPMLSVGVVIALSWTLILAVQLALWPVQQARQDCLQGALTISARNACELQYEKDLDNLRTTLEERSTGA